MAATTVRAQASAVLHQFGTYARESGAWQGPWRGITSVCVCVCVCRVRGDLNSVLVCLSVS